MKWICKRNQQNAHFFLLSDLIELYLSSTCFEQLSVHHQEECTSSFVVFYHASVWTV